MHELHKGNSGLATGRKRQEDYSKEMCKWNCYGVLDHIIKLPGPPPVGKIHGMGRVGSACGVIWTNG